MFFLISNTSLIAEKRTLLVSECDSVVKLGNNHLWLFHDSTGKLGFEELQSITFIESSNLFGTRLPDRFRKGKVWIKLNLVNDLYSSTELVFYADRVKSLELYYTGANRKTKYYFCCDESNPYNAPFDEILPSIKFQVNDIDTAELYIAITATAYWDNLISYKIIKASAYEPGIFSSHLAGRILRHQWFGNIIYGALAIMLLYIASQAIIFKTKEYYYYAIYLAMLLSLALKELMIINESDISFDFLAPVLYSTLSCFTYIMYFLFASTFLNLKSFIPPLYRAVNFAICITLLYMLFDLLMIYYFNNLTLSVKIFDWFRLLLGALSIVMIIITFSKGSKIANYFAIGSLFFVIGGLLFVMNPQLKSLYKAAGIDQTSILYHKGFYYRIGMIVEILFFSMGLAYKSRQTELQKVQIENQYQLEVARRKIELKHAELKVRDEERNRVSRELHDDIGSGLTTIRYLSEIAKSRDTGTIRKELDKISVEAEKIIDNMHDIVWSMNTESDSLDEFISRIRLLIREFLDTHEIKLTFNVIGRSPKVMLSPLQKRNLLLVIKEAVHNTVKHSHADMVNVEINLTNGLSINISDNGIGVNDEVVSGNGLKNMKQRMETIGFDFNISGGNGTVVSISGIVSS
jgi:signal transduction histidine kinase